MGTVFDPFLFASTSADVLRIGCSRPDAVLRAQHERLARLLGAARAGSAIYRQRLAGLPDDGSALAQVEPVARAELMARFADWVTDPQLELDALRAHTADPSRIGLPHLDRYLVWESSGTSGTPGIFVQDARAMAVYDALEALRRAADSGLQRWLDPLYASERIAFVGASGGHFASGVSFQRLCQLQPWRSRTARSFSIQQPLDTLCAALQDFAPTVLATYPSAAVLLAEQAARGKLQLLLREVWTGGETLSLLARQQIVGAWSGCRLRNSYGTSEFLAMGWECAAGQMHLNSDWLLLEPVDEKNRPLPHGQLSHRVLLTNLANQTQPLIRYELGDQIRFQAESCACGSPLPVIQVQGRCDDILQLRALHGGLVAVLPLALSTVLEEQAGVFDFQIRQIDDHTLRLGLPLAGAHGHLALARCRLVLQGFVATLGAAPIRVLGTLGQALPRGRSGKSCRIQALRH